MPNGDRETRYSHTSGSGRNEPKRHERTEQRPDRDPWQRDRTRIDRARDVERPQPPIEPEEPEKVR